MSGQLPVSECGTTTLMTLLCKLVNRPLPASNVSSPAFYRAIHELHPTLLIEEADTLLPGNAQLRGILNAGYTQDMAYVLRVGEKQAKGYYERERRGVTLLGRFYDARSSWLHFFDSRRAVNKLLITC